MPHSPTGGSRRDSRRSRDRSSGRGRSSHHRRRSRSRSDGRHRRRSRSPHRRHRGHHGRRGRSRSDSGSKSRQRSRDDAERGRGGGGGSATTAQAAPAPADLTSMSLEMLLKRRAELLATTRAAGHVQAPGPALVASSATALTAAPGPARQAATPAAVSAPAPRASDTPPMPRGRPDDTPPMPRGGPDDTPPMPRRRPDDTPPMPRGTPADTPPMQRRRPHDTPPTRTAGHRADRASDSATGAGGGVNASSAAATSKRSRWESDSDSEDGKAARKRRRKRKKEKKKKEARRRERERARAAPEPGYQPVGEEAPLEGPAGPESTGAGVGAGAGAGAGSAVEDVAKSDESPMPPLEPATPTWRGGWTPAAAAAFAAATQAQLSYIPSFYGCRSVDAYEKLDILGYGTYGVVYRARDKETGDVVALKQVRMTDKACREGFPITALRETNILLALRHEGIVRVKEMVVGSAAKRVFMVMECMEHELKDLLDKMEQPFDQGEVKCLMQQLLSAVAFMHKHWYIHRDLKPSNLLMDNKGRLAVCDFGLARKYGDPVRPYTPGVVTCWYRAPEVLLAAPKYSTAIDMWSVGCIFGELLTKKPILQGKGELDQLKKTFWLVGSPTKTSWPGAEALRRGAKWKKEKSGLLRLRLKLPKHAFIGSYLSDTGLDLLTRMLTLDPDQSKKAEPARNPRLTPPKGDASDADDKMGRA